MTVIDTHIHVIVPEITRAATGDAWCPQVVWEDGRQLVEFEGKRISSALREFCDIDRILAEQAAAGVDRLVLTPWSSLFRYDAPLDVSLRTGRIQNDALARLAAGHAPRVAALGTVPLQDPQAAADELARCLELGLKGVEIGTNVSGVYLGDDRFRPFWAAAERLGAVVQIHPVSGIGGATNREYYLWNAFANPAETALTTAHMILSGLLVDHPALKISLVHGGGHLPYQIGRLDRAYEMRPEARARLDAPPSRYLRKFYFDTVTHSPAALRFLIDLVGAGQVIVGSDYPFDMGTERPADIVTALGLPPAETAAILAGNAARLFDL